MANSDVTEGKRRLRYAIIGAGMGGILAGIKLNEAGDTDYTIYEKGDGLGGTWRENRYPGLSCDVPSHMYTYSFAPNPDWSCFHAPGPEIRAYFERVADEHGIREKVQFNAEVTSCRYEAGRWHLETGNGLRDVVDVVIAAAGVLHHPQYPEIEGLDSFAGPCFHTARWQDDLSLDGKRVGVIGNGSTGVQLIAAIADSVARLVHFQRSPQWVMPGMDFAYTAEQRADFRANLDKLIASRLAGEFYDQINRFNFAVQHPDSPEMAEVERFAAKHLDDSVADPELREKLRPTYRATCRRSISSPDYYQKVQQPHVLVETTGIERVEPTGVRMTDGSFHELDILVLATGYRPHEYIRPTEVLGRNGVSLNDTWADRPRAYYAISIPEFPNFFMINGPTAPIGNFSLIDVAEKQWGYIEQLIDLLRRGEVREVVASGTSAADYETRCREAASTTIFATGCKSWYLDKDGVPLIWPWSFQVFVDAMAAPLLEDYELA